MRALISLPPSVLCSLVQLCAARCAYRRRPVYRAALFSPGLDGPRVRELDDADSRCSRCSPSVCSFVGLQFRPGRPVFEHEVESHNLILPAAFVPVPGCPVDLHAVLHEAHRGHLQELLPFAPRPPHRRKFQTKLGSSIKGRTAGRVFLQRCAQQTGIF